MFNVLFAKIYSKLNSVLIPFSAKVDRLVKNVSMWVEVIKSSSLLVIATAEKVLV